MLYIVTQRTTSALKRPSTLQTFRCRLSISARSASSNAASHDGMDVARLLSCPSWSVGNLLSTSHRNMMEDSEITVEKLRLLLKLSALPFPTSPEEQASKLKALRTQLHFVRDIQTFDIAGVPPLQAIRDESQDAIKSQTIGVKEVEQTLLQEVLFGHNRRPRRLKVETIRDLEMWDVLDTASQRAGRYIVVNDGKQ